MKVLIAGGAGYIGTHTALVLLRNGIDVVVVDDLSSGSAEGIRRVQDLAARQLRLVVADLTDAVATELALSDVDFDAVIHLAGVKAVGESMLHPVRYFRQNLDSLLTVLELMQRRGIVKLVFSSSATVYSEPHAPLLNEAHTTGTGAMSPYARSKAMCEQIICDTSASWPELDATILRYFNPIGAHPSGCIGDDPRGTPNNLLPFLTQVAVGRREVLTVFGTDYDTPDGTAIRDYLHVLDIADGHAAALNATKSGTRIINLGSGVGNSVLEVIAAFTRATGVPVRWDPAPRRPGDVARLVADSSRAETLLEWSPSRTLEEACREAWRWQAANPRGYGNID
ncbi:UDP-glucose 4-epimerase GalE [Leucobacter sp. G161]|uniref:UDP-glucose 4-epimerase GalE n=1 Tax=Leucobacter sp. G161 TaxID=663704 RepID=UPI00073BC5F4|nr:UDP-glucose 4-epimerase GalE [Leucobacter sp. G161]KUF06080.1 UDP-glucose 4-epimerase [Leucobacter sp. G161]